MTWAEWAESEYNDENVTMNPYTNEMLFDDFYIVKIKNDYNTIKSSSYIFAIDYTINTRLT